MSEDTLMKLGTRFSPLAMAQAEETRARLAKAHGWDIGSIALVPVLASGDKVLDRPLADIGGKALWTKELDEWLAKGAIHAAVHSLKDVETLRPQDFTLAAILPRADKRDRLVGAVSLADLPQGAVIGTSAPRRAAQALHHRPDCTIVPFRGNVATRLAKLQAGEADATFLAAAGMIRLGQDDTGTALDQTQWLPAPAQGAIAIECRADDAQTRQALAALDHQASRAEVMAERAFLRALGGTCHSPVAVLCDHAEGGMTMRAALFSADGRERIDGEARFAVDDLTAAEALGRDLLSRASPAIRALFASPD